MEVAVIDMVNRAFADVRKIIRAPFGQGMRGQRMTVEALIVVEGNGPPRWGLREVKNDTNWRTYMRFASTPGAAMYGRPMVYVKFISATDDAGSSRSAAEEQLSITAGPSTGLSDQLAITAARSIDPSEQMPSHHNVDPGYWSAVVDISEHVEGLPEALDDDARSSSSESSSDEEGVGPPQRAVPGPMDPDFLQTMTISNEFRSVPGLGEDSLLFGQSFPDKDYDLL
jgi:hypothetical protein